MWDKLLGQKTEVGQMALSNIPPLDSYTYTFGTKKKKITPLGKNFCEKVFLHRGKNAKFLAYPLQNTSRCPKA
jgi:hypothetical protein